MKTWLRWVIRVPLIMLGLAAGLVLIAAVAYLLLNHTNGSIVSLGEKRSYLLYVPKSYDPARATPLVISIHGFAEWPAHQAQMTHWNRLAEQDGFIVVYPSGTSFPKRWRTQIAPGTEANPEVTFVSDLIDKLAGKYNIDPERIYANGLSNGGGVTFALSCTLSHRIAAFGPVAAAVTLPVDWCPDPRPAPMIAFHGTADRFTPYDGAKVWLAPEPFPSIPVWTAAWARRNRCAPTPVESAAAADVTRLEYTNCADEAAVVLYTIKGGGHTWPGGQPMPEWLVGRTSRGVDATRQMWAFFRDHPLRRK